MDWKDFLTRRDKRLLESSEWTKRGDFGLGHRPAILVIDVYYAALGVPRAPILDIVAEWPSACGEDGWAAIDRTVDLLAAARPAAIPIIYITSARRGVRHARGTSLRTTRCAEPDGRAIAAEIKPEDEDLIIEKVGPSGFFGTTLDFRLRALGCDTVLICGEATSGCVRATVVDAYELGYQVGVIADCCFDRVEASHWMSLFDMRQKYADLLDSATACELVAASST